MALKKKFKISGVRLAVIAVQYRLLNCLLSSKSGKKTLSVTLTFDYYDQIAADQKCYEFRAVTSKWARRIKGCTEIKCIRGFLPASFGFFQPIAFHM